MVRHSRSRSRSRSPQKKRKHSHRRNDREHKRSRHSRSEVDRDESHVRSHSTKETEDKKTKHNVTTESGIYTSQDQKSTKSSSFVLNNISGEVKDKHKEKHKDINKQESANRDSDVQMQADSKLADSTTSATVAALLDSQEEKIRQRRERVEQWRKEREAAKKAEEEAKLQAVSAASQSSTADDQSLQNSNKGWTLDDDDEDESMEVDETVNLLPIPKSTDKIESQVYQVRRNPLLGLGNKKHIMNNKGKSKEVVAEEEDKSTVSSKGSNIKDSDQMQVDDGDEDPLDAFMKDVEVEVEQLNEQDKKRAKQAARGKNKIDRSDKIMQDEEEMDEEEVISDPEDILALHIIKKLNFEKPTPIQSQAIPAIMAGRDVIGVAKTGSGKTIAFLLPMFRHIKDQRSLDQMEGPIAIIMTPTRELAVQIHKECKHFLKGLNLRAVCAYGGSPIKDQIAELKRGAEIIVCTPGRMIDLLCANSGRVTNLKRVTYLVMKIVNNVRPDRQTVLFSATFPRQMESLARKVLKRPLEITVGGRSVVAQDVNQIVEVREDNTKFVRLLEILGQQYNDDPDARTLIFVDRQEAADNLLRDLIRKGYACMSLHGGKLLIATSVAARGLDVKQLKLVINYECPNHMEDYVHRVGRTGRAGNKGTAYTFITPEQDRYAMDIVKALKLSGGHVSPELQALADGFQEKVKAGNATYSGSGFGGKGLERLDEARDLEAEDEEHSIPQIKKDEILTAPGISSITSKTAVTIPSPANSHSADANPAAIAALKAAQEAAARVNAKNVGASGVQRAKDIIADINARFKENSVQGTAPEADKAENAAEYSVEIEINDYPQKARWKVTNKVELTGAAITTRGTYFAPGRQPAPGSGERKLYLFVEGENEYVVEKAKNEIKRILTETTLSAIEAEARNPGSTSLGGYGKYSVV
ncbi:11180_t:CDS:10 [Funneliformis geosporum]|uniref:RNA helicase n=1 Tax=Funneliformis geosporum TaxID=1117311 RepID=A0A9W4SGX3_9GLOM|nr:11180_t:CDS:10 [Funneliformis geosporum]CAI2168046.1 2189_t:CDS:10 [Funneliformis geosporum]